MYKKILVPHAGTDAGDEALKHAIHIAKSSSGKIALLHIVEEMSLPSMFAMASSERDGIIKSIREANQSIRDDMEKAMQKRVEQCKKEGIKAKAETKIGDASSIIIDYIKENDTDLIVMAKRRKFKGMKKLLSLGSVSRKVVENVTIPTLLIDIENL
ncbi:MAG: universal stress protein [Nitrosopumilaceae archaeon]|nr:universal stress protein [Nitrosopumilaceae archaeon]NIU01778.1 universal stress protein [Nitrosopumilaceae archaeon]NIU88178.1 universal stress protein [Nitrosopumilaceae archaeon]NIV66501.1 universal stress protein [Nitrosopumilaceae archaeon]NIX62380.1 universal stress protein [Nitrosopumilaceae archaeon]